MTFSRTWLLSALVLLLSPIGFAKLNSPDAPSIMTEKELANPAHYPKASTLLKKIMQQYQMHQSKKFKIQSFASTIPFTRIYDGRILVEISTNGNAEEVLKSLKEIGFSDGAVFYKQISGFIPIDKLDALVEHPGIKYVRPSMSMTRVGSTTSQGDPVMKTDEARVQFSVDGSGIKVATISDSYDAIDMPTSLIDDQTTGDLPYPIIGLPSSVPVPPGFGTDEGRAMMQAVFDVAPGATLYFRTGSLGEADFAKGIQELVKANVDIINDDVLNFMEPWFQDGIVAQAASSAVLQGKHFFSAAANQDEQSYQASFTPSAISPPTAAMGPSLQGTLHDFDPGAGDDPFQRFTLADGDGVLILFQWSQPFTSACQGDCPGPTTNLDIALFDTATMTYVAGGADDNVVSGAALEIMFYQNTSGNTQNLDFMISNVNGGPNPVIIKYIIPQGSTADEYHNNASTLVGHANAEGVIAVASAAYFNQPPFSSPPPVANEDSSLGGTPILYDRYNQPLPAPLVRENPDVTGPDGGNNTFFSDDIDDDPDLFPNFFGTSQATPHVAGLAALILDYASSPSSISTSLMEEILEKSCIDIVEDTTPNTYPVGWDFKSGFGLVQAVGPNSAVCGDVDGDGLCINDDECPDDPNKTKPENCGCGATESSCHGRGSGGGVGSYPTFKSRSNPSSASLAPSPRSPVVEPVEHADDDIKPVVQERSSPVAEANPTSVKSDGQGEVATGGCFAPNADPANLFIFMASLFGLHLRRRRK